MEKHLLILGAEYIGGDQYITPWTFPVNSNLKKKKSEHGPLSLERLPGATSTEC